MHYVSSIYKCSKSDVICKVEGAYPYKLKQIMGINRAFTKNKNAHTSVKTGMY